MTVVRPTLVSGAETWGIEVNTRKSIGDRRNENATMDVWSYEAGQDKKWKNKRDNEREERWLKRYVHVLRTEEH